MAQAALDPVPDNGGADSLRDHKTGARRAALLDRVMPAVEARCGGGVWRPQVHDHGTSAGPPAAMYRRGELTATPEALSSS